jgi:hypothetical protein
MTRYLVWFGKASLAVFYTPYHADQFCRALLLNGTPHTLEERRS